MSHICCMMMGLVLGFMAANAMVKDLQSHCNQKGLIYAPYLQSAPEGSNHCVTGGK